MKITFVSESYYPEVGGVASVVEYLAETLAKRGNDVTVLTCMSKLTEKTNSRHNGVEIRRYPLKYSMVFRVIGDQKSFIQDVIQMENDVIILECCQAVLTDLLIPHLTELSGKVILHTHGFSGRSMSFFKKHVSFKNTIGNTYDYLYWKRYYNRFLPKFINNFDEILFLSKADASLPYLNSIYDGRMTELGNAVNDIFFESSNGDKADKSFAERFDIKDKYFLSVANYAPVKNQLGILEQYSQLDKPEADLVFVGSVENSYSRILKKRADAYNGQSTTGKIHVLIGVPRNDVPNAYRGAALYLVASLVEQYSVSIIEAMATGVPFVSTDVGNASFLPGGVVITDLSRMTGKINELMSDQFTYQSLSSKGKQFVIKNCRIEAVVDRLEQSFSFV